MNVALPDVVARLRAAGCVFAEDEAALLVDAAADPTELDTLVARRVAGLPLEQILGWAEFAGLRIAIEPGVFVPRRRTELLVTHAVAAARDVAAGRVPVVVDLGCGSGAIGRAVAAALDRVELHAADIDPAAVRCARRNLEPVGGHVHLGDLYGALPVTLRGRVDVLAVNAPYVPTDAIALMPPEARDHEPRLALDGGADGVDVHRRVASGAPGWFAPGGRLLIETSGGQAPATSATVADAGLAVGVVEDEETGTCVVVGTARRDPRVTSGERGTSDR